MIYRRLAGLKGLLVNAFSSLLWFIRYYQDFKNFIMEGFNIKIQKPFNIINWHLGWKYFYGVLENNTEVFVKLGSDKKLINNEQKMLNILNKNKKAESYFPKVFCYSITDRYFFVALERIAGTTINKLASNDITDAEKGKILHHMIEIIHFLHDEKIIHRDIRPANIMVKNINNLVLIDFATSIKIESNDYVDEVINNREQLKNLGGGLNPQRFKWDDAYTITQVALMLDNAYPIKFYPEWSILQSKIGEVVYNYVEN
jgi:serine/threonine protein kinase